MKTKIKILDSVGFKAYDAVYSLKKQIDIFLEHNEIEIISLSHNVVFGQNLDQENEFTASAIIVYKEL